MSGDGGQLTTVTVSGPLFRSYTLRTLGVGLSYDFVNPTGVFLTMALTGGSNWQIERIEDRGTDETSTASRTGSDLGLGASMHLRLRPVFVGARPTFAVRYERMWGDACLGGLDSACLPGRSVTLSAGLSWVFGGELTIP
jgi:hypothetical protein